MVNEDGLHRLGLALAELGYRFSVVTPATHRLLNARAGNQRAHSLRDIFGWNRPFEPKVVPAALFELMCSTGACEPEVGSLLWRANVRFASLDGQLFAHSPFPTDDAQSVFFGPDSHRFVRALKQHARTARRIVDVGCGTGVGGISLAKLGLGELPVVLADINIDALRLARINARLAEVEAETVHSDILAAVSGDFDLVIANPPYLVDEARRLYRDGGGELGEGLATRIVREAIERFANMAEGGTLLLYSGSPIVEGRDSLLSAVLAHLEHPDVGYLYEELDPDVFADELVLPAYANVERIAAVFLEVHVGRRR